MRRTRWGMIVDLVIWAVAIAWPGWSIPGLLLGATMVSWATFGLLIDVARSSPVNAGVDAAAEGNERTSMGEIDPTGRRTAALDAFLAMKVREGFEIETRRDTHAIVVERSSFLRRLLSAPPRYVVSVDEHGTVSMIPAEPKRS